MAHTDDRLTRAIALFRAENAQDPNTLIEHGQARPKELVDAERLAAWVQRLEPSASEALTLASYCQHLRRWESPRESYEPGRIGYLKWRKDLGRFHADTSARLLREAGYGEDTILAVREINLKQGLRSNGDVQTMEDALCLSFLEHEFAEFSAKHDDAKVIDIVQKTWRKMSDRAHEVALTLPLEGRPLALVQQALAGAPALAD
jgi:uncharacterized protein DUF4202